MGKLMPRLALRNDHPKHPHYPIYAARRLIREELAACKTHLEKLYINRTYLEDRLKSQLNWYKSFGIDKDEPCGARSLLSFGYEDILQAPMLDFIGLRYLQKQINNIRKVIQEKGTEGLDVSTIEAFHEDVWQYGKLISQELWAAHELAQPEEMEEIIRCMAKARHPRQRPLSYADLANLPKSSENFFFMWRLDRCGCYHQQTDLFLELGSHLLQEPARRKRFNPSQLRPCLVRVQTFFHLAEVANLLLEQENGHACVTGTEPSGLKQFVNQWVIGEWPIFDIAALIASFFHKDDICTELVRLDLLPSCYPFVWSLVITNIKVHQYKFSIDSSELAELVDIFEQLAKPKTVDEGTKEITVKKKVKSTAKKPLSEPLKTDASPLIQIEEVAGTGNLTVDTTDNQSVTCRLPQNDDSPQESPTKRCTEHQIDNQLNIISKYRKRGYGKCEEHVKQDNALNSVDIHSRRWSIQDPEQYHSVWRVIFPMTRQDRLVSRVSWPLFVTAMTDNAIGCRVKKADGVLFVFERIDSDGSREIFQCHAPHDLTWIPAGDLKRYKKDLRDTFGMDAERIFLAEG